MGGWVVTFPGVTGALVVGFWVVGFGLVGVGNVTLKLKNVNLSKKSSFSWTHIGLTISYPVSSILNDEQKNFEQSCLDVKHEHNLIYIFVVVWTGAFVVGAGAFVVALTIKFWLIFCWNFIL